LGKDKKEKKRKTIEKTCKNRSRMLTKCIANSFEKTKFENGKAAASLLNLKIDSVCLSYFC